MWTLTVDTGHSGQYIKHIWMLIKSLSHSTSIYLSILLTKITIAQNEATLSYHVVAIFGLYLLAVILQLLSISLRLPPLSE